MGNRRGRGISRAWTIGGVAVVAVLVVGLSGFALTKDNGEHPSASTVPAPQYTSAVADVPQVTAIGDSYTAGSDMDSGATSRWPSLLTADRTVRIQNLAVGSVGFAKAGPKGETFVTQSQAISDTSDAVIFFGSRNDNVAPELVGAGAAEAFTNALAVVPADRVLVVGPAWVDARVPAGIRADRDAIAAAAETAGVRFVDPIAEGWFTDVPNLIGADGVHPTDDGHAYLAEKLRPFVSELIAEP